MTVRDAWEVGDGPVFVVGAGAIGMCVAAALATSGRVPVLVSDWAEHVDALDDTGLVLESDDGVITHEVEAVTTQELGSRGDVRLAYLAVKSQGTAAAADVLADVLADDGAVVSLQNGLNEDVLAERLGPGRVVGGISPISAQRTAPGRVSVVGARRSFVVGELDGALTERLAAIAALSDTEPWHTEQSTNVVGALWSKLLNNTRLNSLCVLSGRPVDATVADPFFRAVMVSMVREFAEVAESAGIRTEAIPSIDVPALLVAARNDEGLAERMLIEHARGFPGAKPSSLQDVEAGRTTEIEHLSGALVRHARRLGVATPTISIVTAAVHDLEREPGRRDEVVARLRSSLPGRSGPGQRPGQSTGGAP